MINENLIATLEQSLRQTRNAQSRLVGRLREVESEADSLRQEIQAMENSAAQTGEAIYSLLATMGTGNKSWKVNKNTQHEEDDYELQNELKRQQPACEAFRITKSKVPGATLRKRRLRLRETAIEMVGLLPLNSKPPATSRL